MANVLSGPRLSGPEWLNSFPTSKSVEDLVEPFRSKAKSFIAALEAAGATVGVNATLRPAARAYLMHWSFCIAREDFDPAQVPAMPGVNIDWVHRDEKGNTFLAACKLAAEQMVQGYDIAFKPVLVSRHTQGLAIDMNIAWTRVALIIVDVNGKKIRISGGNKDGSNPKLQDVGKSYGIIKLESDPPHWSSDGH
jgi:hypothetical protein